jgi:hypothetical protein
VKVNENAMIENIDIENNNVANNIFFGLSIKTSIHYSIGQNTSNQK